MAKLTKGVLARDKAALPGRANENELVFFPGVDVAKVYVDRCGLMFHKPIWGVVAMTWRPSQFRRLYDFNFTLPRPGEIIADVWLEM